MKTNKKIILFCSINTVFYLLFISISILFAATGHGSYAPAAIFFGPVLAMQNLFEAVTGTQLDFFLGLLILSIITSYALWILAYLGKIKKKNLYIWLAVNVAGAGIALLTTSNGHLSSITWQLTAFVISLILVVVYWFWYLWFLIDKKSKI